MMHSAKENSRTSEESRIQVANRIARAAIELCNASTGVVYGYNHESEALFPMGTYSSRFAPRRYSIEDYRWMSDLDEESRFNSVSYTAAREKTAVIYGADTEFAPLRTHHSQVPPPNEMGMPPGKALIAVPIVVLGRLWGVLEVASPKRQCLSADRCSRPWEKLSEVIGPYYHEQTMMSRLYEMSNASPGEAPDSMNLDVLGAPDRRSLPVQFGMCVDPRPALLQDVSLFGHYRASGHLEGAA